MTTEYDTQKAAGRALLAALRTIISLPADDDGHTYAIAIPFADMAAASTAIERAEAAGITAAE